MRLKARVDANQGEIVNALRKIGCSVQHLHQLGKGVPDILVGVNNLNLLYELKDGSKSPSDRRLTTDEITWHDEWRGQVNILESVEDALKSIRYYRESVR